MTKFTFLVRKPSGAWPKEGLPAFVLEQDNWNDYGFQTTYRLSYATLDDKGRVKEDLIGPVKILKKGQTSSDVLLVSKPFFNLDDNYCSVGTSLDYYERLRVLPSKQRKLVLSGLRDLVADPKIEARFRQEEGWSVSLFRDGKDDSYLKLARGLLTGDYRQLPGDDLRFSFALPGWHKPMDFEFTENQPIRQNSATKTGLPERIAILVGRNGSGKSTALARLARIALGTVYEREKAPLSSLGRLEPAALGFPRVVTITFSPFDSFRLPGSDGRDRRKILKELQAGEGRFAFIGLRDIAAEGTRISKSANDAENKDMIDSDRLPVTRLKSIQQLANEFSNYLDRIKERRKSQLFNDVFEVLFADSAFAPYLENGVGKYDPELIRTAFLRSSTGHKIAALVVAGLVATLEPSSLVLFDEPETHLHPPLLAALMDALRRILRNHESYCIVATHSPVVVQESLAKHVKVIRREGSIASANTPKSETFGESIGMITAEVFGLNSEETSFHRVLDKLVMKFTDQEMIEGMFLNGQMSHQARAYVMGQFLAKESKN